MTNQHDGGWKRTASRYLYRSKWFDLRQDEVELPNGEPITYTSVYHQGYALVVPVLDDNHVILEKIYRYTVQQTTLEFPSGGLDGEDPPIAANRELEEETGWSANTLTPLGSFFGSTGISNEKFHVFLGTNLQNTGNIRREATEQIELVTMPLNDVVEMAHQGKLDDAPTALAALLAQSHLN